ncbi:unnamed protein product [Symbiodinium microadriaticum]|nr:unnamed protein product [Symbiodinium microadriaticum]
MASSDPPVSRDMPSFLRRPTDDPLLHPQYDFRAMDYYLASRQGFEDASTVQQRNLDYVEQLPRFAMSLLPPGINSQIELEMYLADLSLTQAYYFRMLPPDAPVDDTRRTDWLRDVFDIDSPDQWATPLAWAEKLWAWLARTEGQFHRPRVTENRKDGGIQILVEHVKNDPILELAFKQILGAANRRIRAVRRAGLDERWGMVQRPITPWLLDMLNHDWEAHPVAVPLAYRGHMFVATASHTPVDRYFAVNIARPGARAMLKYSVLTCLEIVV